MKKVHTLLILIFILSLFILILTSCGARLSTPTGLHLDEDTQTLKWNNVKGAQGYTLTISGFDQEITTQANYYSLEKLEPGNYTISVSANGNDDGFRSSAFAQFEYTREQETGLKYQLINNGTEYTLIGGGSADGDVVMEDTYRGKPVTAISDKALYHNAKITSFTIGKNVKTIGSKAFTKCSKLTEITIPSNVESIGEYAFQSCKVLKKVILPDTVTVIAPYTFAWCSALEEITVGKNLALVDEYAFSNCEKLTTVSYNGANSVQGKVIFPDTLLGIGGYAFADCLSISDMKLGDGIELIGLYAFNGNTSLATVDLGKSLNTLQDGVFYGCTALTTVSLPDTTETLGNGVFFGCETLSDVNIGAGMKYIGSQVFTNTKLLTDATDMLIIDGWLIQVKKTDIANVTFDNNLVGIGSYALSGCSELQNATFKGVKYVGTAAFASCNKLYAVFFDDALLEIGDYAFASSTVTKLTLGNSLQYIGNYAFKGCKLLTKETMKSFTLPKSLTYIGANAFRNTGLYSTTAAGSAVYVGDWVVDFVKSESPTTVAIKDGVRGIAAYTFKGSELVLVSMPDTLEYICRGAFYNSNARMIKLSAGLKYIDDYAFYGCSSTNFGREDFALIIPDGTEYIGRSAFYKCSYILGLTVPGTVEYIGSYAFYGCDAIGATADVQTQKPTGEKDKQGNDIYETVVTKVTGYLLIKDGVKYIDERAFQNCTSLISVTIPDSVIYLGSRAFYKCTLLETVTLGKGITQIPDYAFYKCEALKNVYTTEKLEVVGNYAFRGCTALEMFQFNSVKSIGRYSFYGCASLKEIYIPNTLTSIGDYAFRGCVSVGSVVIPETVTSIGKHAFYNLNETTIYAEPGSISPKWNERFNSSYRPIFWGCNLSEDGSYVVSVTVSKQLLKNSDAKNGITNPTRAGYSFLGWSADSASSEISYTSENIATAPEGTVLYAVWADLSGSVE